MFRAKDADLFTKVFEPTEMMPVHNAIEYFMTMDIVDLDEAHNNLGYEPEYVNDVEAGNAEERDEFMRKFLSFYDNQDTLSPVPSCACPDGGERYGFSIGEICPVCNTRIERRGKESLTPSAWFRPPDGMISYVLPIFWTMMKQACKAGKVCLLTYICDPTSDDPRDIWSSKPSVHAEGVFRRLLDLNVPRGFNSIQTHFDILLPWMLKNIPAGTKRKDFEEFVHLHRSKLFPKFLPFPSRVAYVIEQTSTGTLSDAAIVGAIDAARTVASLKSSHRSKANISRRMTIIMNRMTEYYDTICDKPIFQKKGWARQNALGSMMANSIRGVICGESGVHDYRQITMPYSQTIVALKDIVHRVLQEKHGFTLIQALNYVTKNTAEIDPFLKKVVEDDILSSFNNGLGLEMLWVRYPTLRYLSIQCFFINKVGETATFPVTACRENNSDFDGDQLSGTVATTREMAEIFRRHMHHHAIHSHHKPYELNGAISLPDMSGEIIFNALEREDFPEMFEERPVEEETSLLAEMFPEVAKYARATRTEREVNDNPNLLRENWH